VPEPVPGQYLVVEPNSPRYTIVAAAGFGGADVVGQDAAQVLGEGEQLAQLDAVVRDRLEHAGTPQRVGGAEHWLKPTSAPVFGAGGELRFIVHRVIDVSSFERAHGERDTALYAMKRLHRVSERFLAGDSDAALLEEILDAAMVICAAEAGNIQTCETGAVDLRLVHHRGLPDAWVSRWERVLKGRGACGLALEQRGRVVVEDVETSSVFAGEARNAQLSAGMRAVQSTPFISRMGKALGIISTHWRRPGRPDDSALQQLDLLARLAADILERRSAEAALRHAEAKASGILASSPDAIISMDASRRIAWWNDGAELIFGYSRSEAVGAPFEMLVAPAHLESFHRTLARFADPMVTRQMSAAGAMGRRKSGEDFPISASISKVEIEGEQMLMFSMRDATAERRNELEQTVLAEAGAALASLSYEESLLALLKVLVRHIADVAAILAHEEGQPPQVISAASAPEFEQTVTWMRAMKPGARMRGNPVWSVLQSGRPMMRHFEKGHYEAVASGPEHLAALQAVQPVASIAVPLLLGEQPIGALSLVSSRRRYDERDVKLMQEIARRCAPFIENARLHRRERRAVQTRDEVLGIVAHDLRNPLSTISLQAGLLRRPAPEPERRSRKPANAIEQAARRMDRIIQDLLDVTRLESGNMSIERVVVDADECVHEAVAAHRTQAAARGLLLRLDVSPGLPAVWADKDRVLQVFENLVGNALKFTSSGGITLGAERLGDEVVFSVRDTGVGIATEHLPHVFERIWQAKRTHRSGAGLGLAIVKGLVEAHRGRVWVESTLGTGTTFFFTLPMAAPEAVAAAGQADASQPGVAQGPSAQKGRVVVAEDDVTVREALGDVLEGQGYVVLLASNGAEALALLRSRPAPTVAIVDLAMPVMDGWAVLAERDRDAQLRAIPVIVISGQRGIEEKVAAAHASCLQKPVMAGRLLEAMRAAERTAVLH
jgi:PAS domain S-box-containing protein